MGNLPAAKACLDRGADVNYLHDTDGTTCLMGAVLGKHQELVSLLLEQPGIEVNAKGDGGRTALHEAARRDAPAILRLLLDFPGIDREAQAENMQTPLMDSITFGLTVQMEEFLKTPKVLLSDARLPGLLERRPKMHKMFSEEKRK